MKIGNSDSDMTLESRVKIMKLEICFTAHNANFFLMPVAVILLMTFFKKGLEG